MFSWVAVPSFWICASHAVAIFFVSHLLYTWLMMHLALQREKGGIYLLTIDLYLYLFGNDAAIAAMANSSFTDASIVSYL